MMIVRLRLSFKTYKNSENSTKIMKLTQWILIIVYSLNFISFNITYVIVGNDLPALYESNPSFYSFDLFSKVLSHLILVIGQVLLARGFLYFINLKIKIAVQKDEMIGFQNLLVIVWTLLIFAGNVFLTTSIDVIYFMSVYKYYGRAAGTDV